MIPDFSKLEGFEWDFGNLEHIKKHKVSSKECEEVFFSIPIIVGLDIKHSEVEKRFEVLGKSKKGRRVFLVYTLRENYIRVISARDQNKKERRKYEKVESNT